MDDTGPPPLTAADSVADSTSLAVPGPQNLKSLLLRGRERRLRLERTLRERAEAALTRDDAAEVRDQAAFGRDDESSGQDSRGEVGDEDAQARDAAASDRDALAEVRALAWKLWLESVEASGIPPTALERIWAAARSTDEEREWARRDRANAGLDRASARASRVLSRLDRGDSSEDRCASSHDRAASGRDRDDAAFDGLSSAYTREAGLVELAREVARAMELDAPLTVAYLDIDDLNVGELDDDQLPIDRSLALVVSVLHERLERYDLVIRMGGEQLLCVLPGEDRDHATQFFDGLRTAIGPGPGSGTIRFGIAQHARGDTVLALVDHAKRLTPAPESPSSD